MSFTKILVAYDGSDLGNKALDYAIETAKCDHSVRIHVIHVMSEPSIYLHEYIDAVNLREKMQKEGYEILDKAKKKFSDFNNYRYDTRLLHGRPADQILNYAEREQCDLIVMGSRGLSGLKELLLGSVSHDVVQRSSIPVMILK